MGMCLLLEQIFLKNIAVTHRRLDDLLLVSSWRSLFRVSGRKKQRIPPSNDVLPKSAIGIAAWYSSKIPTKGEMMPPTLEDIEHSPKLVCLGGRNKAQMVEAENGRTSLRKGIVRPAILQFDFRILQLNRKEGTGRWATCFHPGLFLLVGFGTIAAVPLG